MIDWFVLLIPLVLLPILLLLVFVGCGLNKTGLSAPPSDIPIYFTYPGGLHTEVLSLNVKLVVTLKTAEEGDFEPPASFPLELSEASGKPIDPAGATVVGTTVSEGDAGTVGCTCVVVLNEGGAQPELKAEDQTLNGELPASFTLEKTDDGFKLP